MKRFYGLLVGVFLLTQLSAKSQTAFAKAFADSAFTLTQDNVRYDPAYVRIKYPGGDVPEGTGVCSDVVIRAYRKMGIDLQKLVHEDMVANFSKYPQSWGLKKTDSNIDHRRVPNLMTFFTRKGTRLPHSLNKEDYLPGDIVCWNLVGGITHIGIVSSFKAEDGTYKIIHNIGAGQNLDNCLFSYKIIGHYRYEG